MQENQHQSLLTARGVVAFWLIFAASFLVLNLLLAPGRSLQDAIEAELLQGHLSGGYQLKNPPLYEWLLWTVQLVLGPGPLSYLVLRYTLIATTGILFYLALLHTIPDRRLAAAFSISLVLFYWFGWESHHNVSHSLALLVAILAFWLVALAYIERQTAARASVLGLVIGLGIMAKWSFALVLVSFCIALALDASGRRTFTDRRSLLIPAAAAVPMIPFVLWLTRLDPMVIWLHSTRGGDLHGMLRSEAHLLISIPLLFLPWLLVVLFLAWRFRRGGTPWEKPRSESWLALATAAIAIAMMAIVVALVSSGTIPWLTARSVAIRYLAPCSLIAALGIAGVIAARIEHERFASRLALISLAAAAILFLAALAGFAKLPSGTHAPAGFIPYKRLAEELTRRGLGNAQFVSNSPRDAGNIVIYMPAARALALSARVEPPPPDPVTQRACVLIWTEAKHKTKAGQRFLMLLGVTSEVNAIEEVVVKGSSPLGAGEGQTTWHLLRSEKAEQACRRVAARGGLVP